MHFYRPQALTEQGCLQQRDICLQNSEILNPEKNIRTELSPTIKISTMLDIKNKWNLVEVCRRKSMENQRRKE